MKKINLTSEESFVIKEAIEKEQYSEEIGSYWEWKEDKERRYIQAVKDLVPRVGLGCTICYYSDRCAATITEIISPCKIAVRNNKTECKDYYNSEYKILDELEGAPKIFTKRRNGFWVVEGQPYKDGVKLAIHYQHHYIDPGF